MLKAIKKRNFSGYVKKLIMADLNIRKGLIFDEVKDEVYEESIQVKESQPQKPTIKELEKRSLQNKQNKSAQPQSAPLVFRPNINGN
jgi:exopolyphosphatase/pppGpp-phosphohydrolase